MEKEIKFRGFLNGNIYPLHCVYANGNVEYIGCDQKVKLALVDEVKIMQYIGLKDKNGVEIYEKDIIEYYGGYVDFCQDCFSYQIFHNFDKEPYCYSCNGNFTLQESKEDFIVIGNLYQNPNLLY